MKIAIEHAGQVRLRAEEPFRVEADKRRVVLVYAMDGDAIRGGARGFGERRAPREVGFIENPGPIHRADDDRQSHAEQHQADGLERIVEAADGLDPAATERMSERGSDIETEGREMDIAWGGRRRPRQARAERGGRADGRVPEKRAAAGHRHGGGATGKLCHASMLRLNTARGSSLIPYP